MTNFWHSLQQSFLARRLIIALLPVLTASIIWQWGHFLLDVPDHPVTDDIRILTRVDTTLSPDFSILDYPTVWMWNDKHAMYFSGLIFTLNGQLSTQKESVRGDWLIFEHPIIDLDLEPGAEPDIAPFTHADFASVPTAADIVFDVTNHNQWKLHGIAEIADGVFYDTELIAEGEQEEMLFMEERNICLSDYRYLAFQMDATDYIGYRSLEFQYQINGKPRWYSIEIPFWIEQPDTGDLYYYPTRLFPRQGGT